MAAQIHIRSLPSSSSCSSASPSSSSLVGHGVGSLVSYVSECTPCSLSERALCLSRPLGHAPFDDDDDGAFTFRGVDGSSCQAHYSDSGGGGGDYLHTSPPEVSPSTKAFLILSRPSSAQRAAVESHVSNSFNSFQTVVSASARSWPAWVTNLKVGLISAQLILPVAGGKGGFGTLLKSLAKKKTEETNFDACRSLDGRRVREESAARKLKEWESEEEQRKLEKEANKFIREKSRDDERDKELDGAAKQAADASAAVTAAVSSAVREAEEARKRKRGEAASASTSQGACGGLVTNNKSADPKLKKRKKVLGLDDDDDEDDRLLNNKSNLLTK
ncbi:Sde2_N_Ubi domain-containing protein [Pycnococcus provasolii]